MYCAVGEYRSSMFLRNACNTYCKTTKCRDPSNHKRHFQRSGKLESLLRIQTAANWYAGSAGFHNMRLHSTRTDQLLEQMGKTQAETLNTAERHGICLRTETRRSASGKISPTSAFRVHKFEADEILTVGGRWKLRLWSSGLWQQVFSWVATNISNPVVCSFEKECALKMEATKSK